MIWYFASSVLIQTCANFCTGSLETHPKPRNRTSASCAFSRFFTFTILLTSEYSQRQYLARILKFCFPSLENRKILYDVQQSLLLEHSFIESIEGGIGCRIVRFLSFFFHYRNPYLAIRMSLSIRIHFCKRKRKGFCQLIIRCHKPFCINSCHCILKCRRKLSLIWKYRPCSCFHWQSF